MAQSEVTEPVAQVADSSGAVTEEKGQEEQKKGFCGVRYLSPCGR